MGPLRYLLNLLLPPEPEPERVLIPDTLRSGFPEAYSMLIGECVADLEGDWSLVCAAAVEDGWLTTAGWCWDTCTLTVGEAPLEMAVRLPLGSTPRQAAYAAVAAITAATSVVDMDWEEECTE